ncbi:hypothetical protein FOZ76_00605 [Verticiella sediminum]|uniref:DUF2783 domain-containing protein n=1 Tax=Verticiella sediminum TaxID=1247510 RepID=A0A556B269_9BURK|nr:hypothetical protein [Verticiella sediminum]TSH99262.1 hypothetical protein FOZ76_00605 [Verticiella sediminum]
MTETDLDKSYTALSEAISRVGPERAQLLLAMVALSLMAHAPDAEDVLARIAQAEARLLEEAA